MKILKDILYGARISEVIGSTHIAVESVVADSRQVKPFGCFVAIAGTAVDGHDHIAGAIRAGGASRRLAARQRSIGSLVEGKELGEALRRSTPCFYAFPSC